ncbi:MAG: hypothetical protein J2P43_03240 [Candidatus Dormibacteraeota bacterium]|nr:hypothetical protein [Candidatus Dormibacteraeota bacterium]MBO0744009.1 hypothetical protein [Candidatus Dormibacteraeota bacterium]
MWGKLAFFCLGFALGTRTGREGLRDAIALVRWTLSQDEVRAAVVVAQNLAATALERGQELALRRVA